MYEVPQCSPNRLAWVSEPRRGYRVLWGGETIGGMVIFKSHHHPYQNLFLWDNLADNKNLPILAHTYNSTLSDNKNSNVNIRACNNYNCVRA